MYFPPPPNSLAAQQMKSKSISKARSQKQTSAMKKLQSSVAPRRFFTMTILLLSFVVMILAVIFASCVSLPHVNYNSTDDMSTINRRDTQNAYPLGPESAQTNNITQNDQNKQAIYSKASNMAALGFYSITLPFLTMLHSAMELMILCIRPQTVSTTAAGRERFGTLLPTLSLLASVVLLLGWVPMNIIWMNCEVPSAQIISPAKVCPVQTRGHNMGGIDEVSIAKIVFAWLIVVLYVSYAVYGFVARRTKTNSRQVRRARFASDDDEADEHITTPDEELAKEVR